MHTLPPIMAGIRVQGAKKPGLPRTSPSASSLESGVQGAEPGRIATFVSRRIFGGFGGQSLGRGSEAHAKNAAMRVWEPKSSTRNKNATPKKTRNHHLYRYVYSSRVGFLVACFGFHMYRVRVQVETSRVSCVFLVSLVPG